MNSINYFIELFIHLDKHLSLLADQHGMLIYLVLFLIIFCETGLVVTPFLPGDSLIFATGTLAASGTLKVSYLLLILIAGALAGDFTNYNIGGLLRDKVAKRKNIRFIKRKYLTRTEMFYDKYGAKTLIIARFIPIIRTFSPFVAGLINMPFKKFISISFIAGIAWVISFLLGGYLFGNLPFVKHNFSIVIIGIILVSLLPGLVTYIKSRYTTNGIN